MYWLNSRAVIIGVFALACVGIGILFLVRNSPQTGSTDSWGSGVAPKLPESTTPTNTQLSAHELFTILTGQDNVSLPPLNTVSFEFVPKSNGQYSFSNDDVVALLQSIVPSAHTVNTSETFSLHEVYSFIPSAAVSAYAPQTNTTPLQKELYAYGNAAGAIIQEHESAWLPYQNQILQNFLDNRSSATAQARVFDLARGMDTTAEKLELLSKVPTSTQSSHTALVVGYRALARETRAVANAGSDDSALLSAINESNAAADAFSTAYVAISDTLTGAHVEFSMGDPGRVFIFSSH